MVLEAHIPIYFDHDKISTGNYCATNFANAVIRIKADVSRMMAIMEKKGLVIKEGTNQNLYRGVFKLTETGKESC